MGVSREDYAWYKSRGICARCRSAPAFGHFTCCPECMEKIANRMAKAYHANPEKYRADQKARRLRWAEQNRCTRCGGRKPEGDPHRTCPACRLHFRGKERYRTIRPAGICHFCSNPVAEGQKVCTAHLEKLRARAALARQSVDRKNHIWRDMERARHAQMEARYKDERTGEADL